MKTKTDQISKHQKMGKLESATLMFSFSSISIILHNLLTNYNLDARDLANLDASCSYFGQIFDYKDNLSWTEAAALVLCKRRLVSFMSMTTSQLQDLKHRCGGSWKRVLRFLLASEFCSRRGKSQVLSGPQHSIVVSSRGDVCSFGNNKSGQLGYDTQGHKSLPREIRSLGGIIIVQAAVGNQRTLLVSDIGRVYACGVTSFGEVSDTNQNGVNHVFTPQLVNSLKDIFVVDVTIGHYFTAVLSREGIVYTLSLRDNVIGHQSNANNIKPRRLLGDLEHLPVVQISAGNCYLLALACNSTGMSVYSVGCGKVGQLGHGGTTNKRKPKMITTLINLNIQPVMVSAGYLHGVVLGKDGRVCTWGYGFSGCLGHGNQVSYLVPKVVESLAHLKAVYVSSGICMTFVVTEDNDVYSLGCISPPSVGRQGQNANLGDFIDPSLLVPLRVPHLKEILQGRIVQISTTNDFMGSPHTMVLTETNKVYSFGAGGSCQLGVELPGSVTKREIPMRVEINLDRRI